MPIPTRSRRNVLYAIPYTTARRIEELAQHKGWHPYEIIAWGVNVLWAVYAKQANKKHAPDLESRTAVATLTTKALDNIFQDIRTMHP